VITPLLTAFLVLSFAPQGVHPEPEPAPTTARTQPPAKPDSDAELLRDLELLQKLELLEHLDLFDEGR
jgi:hypothetical protein